MSNKLQEAQARAQQAAKQAESLRKQLEEAQQAAEQAQKEFEEAQQAAQVRENEIRDEINTATEEVSYKFDYFKEILRSIPPKLILNFIANLQDFTAQDVNILLNTSKEGELNLEASNFTDQIVDQLNEKLADFNFVYSKNENGVFILTKKDSASRQETNENPESEVVGNIETTDDAKTPETDSNIEAQTIDFNNKETYIDIEVKPENLPKAYTVVTRNVNGKTLYTIVGEKLDLKGANLSDADLQFADLTDANLQEANLQGANLQYADLEGANLQGANLQYADLEGADSRGANLQGANLQEANLQGANLQYADLEGANLQGANLQYADLEGANLQGANLQRADLHEVNLQGAKLHSAKLQGAKVYSANLTDAVLQGADLQRAWLHRANFKNAILTRADLQFADLTEANLDGANLSNANLKNAKLIKLTGVPKEENLPDGYVIQSNENGTFNIQLIPVEPEVEPIDLEEIKLEYTIDGIDHSQLIDIKKLTKLLFDRSFSGTGEKIMRALLHSINNPLTAAELAKLAGLDEEKKGYPNRYINKIFSEFLKESYGEFIFIPRATGSFKKMFLTLKEEFYRKLIADLETSTNEIPGIETVEKSNSNENINTENIQNSLSNEKTQEITIEDVCEEVIAKTQAEVNVQTEVIDQAEVNVTENPNKIVDAAKQKFADSLLSYLAKK
ncbi:pentapeptide repeat-containing protein [bacterium]|nr:pentapeptide repeat-containing protein [bacterium]MBT6293249.1 pentapeptide repeat-containing protein [bacterium]